MIKELIKLANALDEEGLLYEADQIDELIEESYDSKPTDDETYDDISPEVMQGEAEYTEKLPEIESDYDGDWSVYR